MTHEQFAEVLLQLLDADTWEAAQQIVEAHPVLLRPEVDEVLEELIAQHADNAQVQHVLEDYCYVLRQCRALGIAAAFANRLTAEASPSPLDILLEALSQPAQIEEMPQRLEQCRQALTLLDKATDPLLWGSIQHELGNSLIQIQTGDRADNLEQAIAAYRQALTVITQDTSPVEWAITMRNLATAYRERLLGDRAENIDNAIAAYQQALAIHTRPAMPEAWGSTMLALADAYVDRVRGERADNIEMAIAMYQQVLDVFTRQARPFAWAATTTNLARAYHHRIRGEQTDNVERALGLYQQVLDIVTRHAMPLEWAQLIGNMATAYMDRIRGERADNIEVAITMYQQALDVLTRQTLPLEWAQLMVNLAVAYRQRLRGERPANLEQALTTLQQALDVLDRTTMAVPWATAMMDLANAYANRLQGERAENLERAIMLYQQVLEVMTRDAMPLDWAMTMMNLGLTYATRLRGDEADNLELAIDAYQQALTVRTRAAMPAEWAMTMMHLANAYRHRVYGERATNIEQAITMYQQALEVMTCDTMPVAWAQILMNLGIAYADRRQGEKAANLEYAITAYTKTLSVLTHAAMPFDWATTMINLANAYSDRVAGARTENLAKAIATYQQALDQIPCPTMPNEHRIIQWNLARLYFREQQWAEAYTAYAAALAARELLYQASATPEARHAELRVARELPVRAAYCLARLGRVTEAVTTLEQGKARLLGEVLARDEVQFEAMTAADQEAFTAARTRIAALEVEARALDQPGARDFVAISTELRQAREALNAVVNRIRTYVPDFLPVGLDAARIAAVAQAVGHPLVYLLTTTAGSLAMIVPPQEAAWTDAQVVWLNDFHTDDLHNLLYNRTGEPGYLLGAMMTDPPLFMQILDAMWSVLEAQVMAPISSRLRLLGYHRAVLIPTGTLSLLPLHAISCDDIIYTLAPSARVLQAAGVAVRIREQASPVLLGIGNPLPHPWPLPFARREVEAIEPLFPPASRRVLYEEQATKTAIFGMLSGATHVHWACHGAFNLTAPLDSALYLAGNEPLTLREILERKHAFSAARLVILSACQTGLIDFWNVPDEAVGLPAGVLQAGVPGVISTLWPVADLSTALLLTRFYRGHLHDGADPAIALHQAQQWLRHATVADLALTDYYAQQYEASGRRDAAAFRAMRHYRACPDRQPFAHPYYWAAFVYTGV